MNVKNAVNTVKKPMRVASLRILGYRLDQSVTVVFLHVLCQSVLVSLYCSCQQGLEGSKSILQR